MKVILREEVKNLGDMGDIVNVKPGYARNFLIPKGFALEAATRNIKALEHEKKAIQQRAVKLLDTAKALAGKLSKVSLTLKAKAGEGEKLFGSITTMDIARALKDAGFDMDRRKLVLEEPIKRLGEHSVDVRLAANVTASFNINVVPE